MAHIYTREQRREIKNINAQRAYERQTSKPTKGEQAVINFCEKYSLSYSREHAHGSIKSGLYQMFIDVYLIDYRLAIEFDGEQHYQPVFGLKALEAQCKSDKVKDAKCKRAGIELVRIPYNEISKIESTLLQKIMMMVPKNRGIENHNFQFGTDYEMKVYDVKPPKPLINVNVTNVHRTCFKCKKGIVKNSECLYHRGQSKNKRYSHIECPVL